MFQSGEDMSATNARFGLVDAVWAEASDARWHTPEDIAKRTKSTVEKVASVLSFLKRYGFIRSSTASGKSFIIRSKAPRPEEAARILELMMPRCNWDESDV